MDWSDLTKLLCTRKICPRHVRYLGWDRMKKYYCISCDFKRRPWRQAYNSISIVILHQAVAVVVTTIMLVTCVCWARYKCLSPHFSMWKCVLFNCGLLLWNVLYVLLRSPLKYKVLRTRKTVLATWSEAHCLVSWVVP